MRVILYDNGSSDEVLNKELTEIVSADTEPYNEVDIISPTFILSDMEIENIDRCNYCYVEDLGRYYFCSPKIRDERRRCDSSQAGDGARSAESLQTRTK